MKYSSRFFLYAPFGLFLAIALGVGVHWWIAASALSARLQAMNGHQIVPGVTMRFASRSITGFPFSLDTVFRGASFRVDTPHGPTQWRPEEFAMHSLTYGRDETIFEAAGKQDLSWTKDDGSKRTLAFAVGSLHASAIRDGGGLARFDLDLVGFGSRDFTAQRLQFHIRHDGHDGLDFIVTADGARPSRGSCPELGDKPVSGELTGTITKARALAAFLAGRQDWGAAIAHWRSTRGTAAIVVLQFESPAGQSGWASRLQTTFANTPAEKLSEVSSLTDAACGDGH
ncbi:MAG: DUF2125 domain-containing protein [Alphaproteobacteria bacterium]|nr:DUF2125 domain-containing protein [Alphaproteobacteria bacterium]MDE2629538.1 DUF2125 domain-containing protein [Alphaproteobacteria bacterium]